MPSILTHLGYTNNNFLYNMVMTHKKTTTGKITTAVTENLENVFMPDKTDYIINDSYKVETNNDPNPMMGSLIGLIPLGIAITVYLIYVLFKWCVKKILARCRGSNPRETTPLLQHKITVGGQPPSYAELSPTYPSPPMFEDL